MTRVATVENARSPRRGSGLVEDVRGDVGREHDRAAPAPPARDWPPEPAAISITRVPAPTRATSSMRVGRLAEPAVEDGVPAVPRRRSVLPLDVRRLLVGHRVEARSCHLRPPRSSRGDRASDTLSNRSGWSVRMWSRAPWTTSSVGVATDHIAALTGDLLRHDCSFRSGLLVVRGRRWVYVGAELSRGKVQLCGRFVVELDDRRVEDELPGRQGRLLLAFLVAHRLPDGVARGADRGALAGRAATVAWRRSSPSCAVCVPLDGLRPGVDDLWVDIEARSGRRAPRRERLALGDPHAAWGPSQVAMFVTGRPFLAGEDARLDRRGTPARWASCTCALSRRTPGVDARGRRHRAVRGQCAPGRQLGRARAVPRMRVIGS